MVQTPPNTRTRQGVYHGRWRWWYASICDYRIAHPGCKVEEIATSLRKHANTIYAIVSSDMYKEYEAQRLQAFRDQADTDLRLRMTEVASLALDIQIAQMKKKQDQVPLTIAREIAESALDRLGFAPQTGPSVVVNANQQNVVLPNAVSPAALEEARSALRAVEHARLTQRMDHVLEVEAEQVPSSAELEAPGGGTARPADS